MTLELGKPTTTVPPTSLSVCAPDAAACPLSGEPAAMRFPPFKITLLFEFKASS